MRFEKKINKHEPHYWKAHATCNTRAFLGYQLDKIIFSSKLFHSKATDYILNRNGFKSVRSYIMLPER